MSDLLLQPTGHPDGYEAAADGQIVGRVVLRAGAWSWAIDTAFRPGRHPVYGFEPTRDAATQAFARSWRLKLSETEMKPNSGAQFEISIDGVPHTYRDGRDMAVQTAQLLKSRNPNSVVKLKDLQTG